MARVSGRWKRAAGVVILVALCSALIAAAVGRGSNRHDTPVGLREMSQPGPWLANALGELSLTLHRIEQPPPHPLPTVALLNATKTPGMAAEASFQVRPEFNASPVFNYPVVVKHSRVEFQPGGLDEARQVASLLAIATVVPMIKRTIKPAGTAPVAVVIGSDRVPRG